MITKLTMNNVNSFKCCEVLETDKKINLIYGLNGTGKSTISNYFYDAGDSRYYNCSIEGPGDEEIFVYNQRFIRDNFYESEELEGIFTLSKVNKDAESKIKSAKDKIKVINIKKEEISNLIEDRKNKLQSRKKKTEDRVWDIKTKYSGGDRVFDYCFDNLRSSKSRLLEYLLELNKPSSQPIKTIIKLEKESELIQSSDSKKHEIFPRIEFGAGTIESNQLLNKAIVGNENSTVAELINKLKNSDWIKDGLGYIPTDLGEEIIHCPFCQEKTVTKELVNDIKEYFDVTYENDINELKRLLSIYERNIKLIPSKEFYEFNTFLLEDKTNFDRLYDAMMHCLYGNKDKIEDKIKTPSQLIEMIDSSSKISEFNQLIESINEKILEYNKKVESKQKTLNVYKKKFWSIMRYEYDQTLCSFIDDNTAILKEIKDLSTNLTNINDNLIVQNLIIQQEQKNTVNIDEAVGNINSGLIELGIDDFFIEKYTDDLYKINRHDKCERVFHSLSEGEKMIISFLYFRELCKGVRKTSTNSNKKIVVIDDPMSSLSHIYMFNIGNMIKNNFFKSDDYKQVFLLTHSLYFFYEMTDINHTRRKETQKLFRLIKNDDGSHISTMKYEEIQNDYQSYWSIIKDDKHRPALIANCMRNIIEYFFTFVEKKDLSNLFQKSELKDDKYQAFYRYINRESHSLGQNIFDIKEFDYDIFKEALKLVFRESGYEAHYEKMIS